MFVTVNIIAYGWMYFVSNLQLVISLSYNSLNADEHESTKMCDNSNDCC